MVTLGVVGMEVVPLYKSCDVASHDSDVVAWVCSNLGLVHLT